VAELTLRARGPASPELVWQRYAEPQRWPSWSPQVQRVDYPHPRLRPHTLGRVQGPGPLGVQFRVDAVDEQQRTWAWTVWPQLAGRTVTRMRLEHGVELAERPGARSATWLRLQARAPVVAVYAPVARLALRRLVR